MRRSKRWLLAALFSSAAACNGGSTAERGPLGSIITPRAEQLSKDVPAVGEKTGHELEIRAKVDQVRNASQTPAVLKMPGGREQVRWVQGDSRSRVRVLKYLLNSRDWLLMQRRNEPGGDVVFTFLRLTPPNSERPDWIDVPVAEPTLDIGLKSP